MKRRWRPSPFLPVPPQNIAVIEAAGLWSLIDCRAGKPPDEWRPELQGQSMMVLELAAVGIGGADEAALAERALEVLAGDLLTDTKTLAAVAATLPQQLRLCNWRTFGAAQDRVLAAVSNYPLTRRAIGQPAPI